MLRTPDFKYELPPELIAQEPAARRDASRLFVFDRTTEAIEHRMFADLPKLLSRENLLVVNNTKVIPARMHAVKASGGAIEILLFEEVRRNEWWVMLKPGKRVRKGTMLHVLDHFGGKTSVVLEVLEKSEVGHYRVSSHGTGDLLGELGRIGEVPLPPYIRRDEGTRPEDDERYQTVFAQAAGSVAAPTAGLHFTPEILAQIRNNGVEIAEVTLHVGLGTFSPVKVESLAEHKMHEERYEIGPEAAKKIAEAKRSGRRVIAVGTTSLRVLESVAAKHGEVIATSGKTRLFVYPPYDFKVVDALLTNFHLPESTLLMLVSAFAAPGKTEGRDLMMKAYTEAIRERYRFFSYGDAMFIV